MYSAESDRPQTAPPVRPPRPAAYLHLSFFVGMLAVFAIALATDPQPFLHPKLLIWVAAMAVIDLLPVPAWESATVGMDLPVCVAIAILYPAPVAGLIAFVGAFDLREFRRQIPLSRALFNRSQIAFSTMVVGLVYHLWGHALSPVHVLLPCALAGIVAGYAANVGLVATAMSLDFGISPRAALGHLRIGGLLEFLASYLGLGLLGALLAYLVGRNGLWSIVVVVAPLVFARQMFYRSKTLQETTDELRERERLLADQTRRLEHLLGKEQHATAELRELNRMRSEFLAVASHELRTPLTAILGFAKTLRQRQFSEDADLREESLAAIERQADRLLRMVQNLFDAHLVEAAQVMPSFGRVALDDLCREVVEGLGPEGARVRAELPDDLPWLLTDRDLLGRVLANLLDNALKYSPPDLPCELGARSEDGMVSLWVSDRGSGISPDKLGRIFEPFYQADSSSVRRFRGAGLGLSVAAGLTEHLGGHIDVQSEPGVGSTFTLVLPVEPSGARSGGKGTRSPNGLPAG